MIAAEIDDELVVLDPSDASLAPADDEPVIALAEIEVPAVLRHHRGAAVSWRTAPCWVAVRGSDDQWDRAYTIEPNAAAHAGDRLPAGQRPAAGRETRAGADTAAQRLGHVVQGPPGMGRASVGPCDVIHQLVNSGRSQLIGAIGMDHVRVFQRFPRHAEHRRPPVPDRPIGTHGLPRAQEQGQLHRWSYDEGHAHLRLPPEPLTRRLN